MKRESEVSEVSGVEQVLQKKSISHLGSSNSTKEKGGPLRSASLILIVKFRVYRA